MNTALKDIIKNISPSIKNLEGTESDLYELALSLLSNIVSPDFLDIPLRQSDEMNITDGLYYTIPHCNAESLLSRGEERTLISVDKVENNISICSINIGVEFNKENSYRFTVYDPTTSYSGKRTLFVYNNGLYSSDIPNYNRVKIFDLVKLLANK